MYLLANRERVVDEKKAAEVAGYLQEAGGRKEASADFNEFLQQQRCGELPDNNGSARAKAKLLYLKFG